SPPPAAAAAGGERGVYRCEAGRGGAGGAVRPPRSLGTQSAVSTAAAHPCRFRQDTEPSWSVGSELTVDHEVPPSRVPASATEVPAPATQHRWTLAHATE